MTKTVRTFIPGSDWLYFKIYSGHYFYETFLRKDINNIVRKLEKENIISKWSLVRYADPEFHIRIRFLINDKNDLVKVIQTVYDKMCFLIGQQISKIQKFKSTPMKGSWKGTEKY
ncbi:hypothetical protein HP439_09435 [Sphingobacterium shayense]|uniref:thiopeptide-type bacteriocin biosynthesis protein n=1 Tax=Sphingobacterium shayense TaxID=626343 RepID=UPI001551CAD7|nr:hypothetical protein [Sphingobacterium shayense]